MFSSKKDLDTLQRELEAVLTQINAHPFNSEETKAANNIIESSEQKNPDQINSELSSKDLPDLSQMGSKTVSGLQSWGKLHREKKRLESQIEKLEKRKLA